jgi:hypothetical protein
MDFTYSLTFNATASVTAVPAGNWCICRGDNGRIGSCKPEDGDR